MIITKGSLKSTKEESKTNNAKGEGHNLPKGGYMKIPELVTEIRKTAMELNMEFAELVEWLIQEDNNKLPWEE